MSYRYNDWDDLGYDSDYDRYARGFGFESENYYDRRDFGTSYNEPDSGRRRSSYDYANRYPGGGFRGDYPSRRRPGDQREDYGYSDQYQYGPPYGRHQSRGYRDERDWMDRAGDEVASWFGDEEAERRRRMDERRQGHRGRGPKGYRRSDDRIREDVSDRLWDNRQIDASEVQVDVENGVVQLSGTVDSRWIKRRIEEIAEEVTGVTDVENRLRIDRTNVDESATDTTTTASKSATAKS